MTKANATAIATAIEDRFANPDRWLAAAEAAKTHVAQVHSFTGLGAENGNDFSFATARPVTFVAAEAF